MIALFIMVIVLAFLNPQTMPANQCISLTMEPTTLHKKACSCVKAKGPQGIAGYCQHDEP